MPARLFIFPLLLFLLTLFFLLPLFLLLLLMLRQFTATLDLLRGLLGGLLVGHALHLSIA